MIPAGMLDGGKIANHVFKPLWVPGLFVLLWVAYKFSSGGWEQILVALLVVWPAAKRALSIFQEQRRESLFESSPENRSDIRRVAAIAIGVVVFGSVGMLAAHSQHQDLTRMRWLDPFSEDPRNWNFPLADEASEPGASQTPQTGCL
jgi:hypothetical protein